MKMAGFSRYDIRVIKSCNFKRGLTKQKCFEEIYSALRETCPFLRTIQQWYIIFPFLKVLN